jgi:prevent-host-death family protein
MDPRIEAKSKSIVNMHQAKTHLSRLAERAHRGEEIVLAKAGKPYAKLVPLEPKGRERAPGQLRGLIVRDDLLEPDPASAAARPRPRRGR